jgi:hypothetical protein
MLGVSIYFITKSSESRLIMAGKTKYRTGKDLYRWSRGKSRSFLKTLKIFSALKKDLDFYGTNGSPILPICIQYSLIMVKVVTTSMFHLRNIVNAITSLCYQGDHIKSFFRSL